MEARSPWVEASTDPESRMPVVKNMPKYSHVTALLPELIVVRLLLGVIQHADCYL